MIKFLVLILSATMAVASCTSSSPASVSNSAELEDVLFLPIEDLFSLEYAEDVDNCMRTNGFDDFSYVAFFGERETESSVTSDFIDELAEISERGSGITYSFFYFDPVRISGTGSESGLAALDLQSAEGQKLAKTLHDGPITAPSVGTYDEGCEFWALDELLRSHPEYEIVADAADEYSTRVSSVAFESNEYHALEAEWSLCMAQTGFGGLSQPGDQFESIIERATSLASQELTPASPEVQELMEYDREVSLASHGCWAQIVDRREAMKFAVAEEILTEFPGLGDLLDR